MKFNLYYLFVLIFVLQKEWLCLNCQTQRAMSGQLGDMPPPAMASPKKQPSAPAPAPSSTPAPAAVDSKPVVEAADPTPAAPDAKVVPEAIPEPDHNAPLSVSTPPPDCTPQETPQPEDQKEPLAAEPVSEPVIHPEQEAQISESVAESIPAVDQQQNSSEKIAEGHPVLEAEPSDADQQTQSSPVSEIAAVEQQESSSGKAAEDPPNSETEPSNAEQQAQGSTVSEQQSSSKIATEDLSLPAESETQNLLTNTGLDNKAVPAEAETEPNPPIIQNEAAAPLTDNEKVEPTREKPPEVTTDPIEPKPDLIAEAASQEVPPQPDPVSTATNGKDEKIAEVEQSEKPQIDEPQTTATGQIPSDTVDTNVNVEQTDTATKVEAESVAPDVKNDVTAEIKVEPEPNIETPVSKEGAPPPPAEAVENVTPADDAEVPKTKETQQELKPEPAKCVESESSPEVSDNKHPVSASVEESQTNKEENKPVEKEEETVPIGPEDKSPPVAPVQGETSSLEKAKEESTVENKVVEKVSIEEEMAKERISERAGLETSVEMKTIKDTAEEKNVEKEAVEKGTIEERAIEEAGTENKLSNTKGFEGEEVQNNAAAERSIEVKADEGKALEGEATEQKTVEKANDQKPLEEEVIKAESSPAPSSAETENICPVIDKKESETTTTELPPPVAEEIPKDETHKEIEPATKQEPSPAEESLVKTVSLSEETEKPMVEAESEAKQEEKQTPIDTMLKADDKSENAVVTSEEKVDGKESVPSVEKESGVTSEAPVGDKDIEEKLIRDETEAGSKKSNIAAEDQCEIERETSALTGSDGEQLEKVPEHNVLIKEEEENVKKEVESQPVAGNIQEPISVSEMSTVCDKDGAAQFDVENNSISKKEEVLETAFENGGVSVSVASVPVAEPEIPVSVVSEQDKGPKEENTNVEETKEANAEPLGKPSDEDTVAEVTIVFSTSGGRLYYYLFRFISAIIKKRDTEINEGIWRLMEKAKLYILPYLRMFS